jgi:murein DD-endopeptidase MepM/ murein hydrolase activator NlpD
MSIGQFRAIAYGAMALFAVGAIAFTRPLPRVALATASRVEQGSDRRVRHDTLGKGETLVHVFVRAGMTSTEARAAMASTHLLQPGVIRVGMPLQFSSRTNESQPTSVRIGLAIDRYLNLKKTETGWVDSEEILSWETDTIVVSGVITSHLTAAVDSAAKPQLGAAQRRQLTYALADLYEFRVDMSRDLRVGDSFTVVAERQSGPDGAVRIGRVIVASMKLSRNVVDAIPFKSAKVSGEFFDGEGKPLRCCFLRAPLEFRRISSGFGLRRHPILGTMRRHEGTDYAASQGTPVRAIGSGVVIKAGWGNGYGNVVELRHPNGYVTRYGHMVGFAKGIARGSRVEVGRTIGYVGSTGLATGPHLHFEVLVNGAQRNPSLALGKTGTAAIPAAERPMFAEAKSVALALLRSSAVLATSDSGARIGQTTQTSPQR